MFGTFVRANSWLLLLYVGLLCLAYPVEQVVFPEIYGRIVSVLTTKSQATLFQRTWKYLVIATALLVIAQILFTCIDYIDAYVQPALQSHFREQIVADVLHTFQKKYKTLQVGNIVSKVAKLPIVIRQLYHQIRTYMFPAVLVSFFACIYFFYLHVELGLMLTVVMLLFFAFFAWKSMRCVTSSQQRDVLCDKLNEDIDDVLNNLLSVYASTTIDDEQARLKKKQHEHDKQYTTSSLCGVDFKIWYSVFYVGLFIVINGYAFYLTHRKKLVLGQLVSVVFVTLYLINNVGDFAGEIKDFTYNIGVLAEMQRYIDELFAFGGGGVGGRTLPTTPDTPNTFSVTDGQIVFENVSYTYDNSTTKALDDVSFSVQGGTSVALVGKIGSGKSTVTKLVLRLYEPGTGTILIDGKAINRLHPVVVREHVGYVSQTPVLFNRSIYDNIVYGSKKPVSKQEVWLFIRQSGVEPLFETVENGLDTLVGKRGEHLSGGQRQTIALLRLALSDSHKRIFLLDEPTSALDYESKHYVLQLLKKLMQNHTCLVVTHDDEVVSITDSVLAFRGGRVHTS
jgi:ABC-type multidrug transport system fused ATPase/permease subunit